MRKSLLSVVIVAALAMFSSYSHASIIIADNFEADTSGNYTRVSNDLNNGSAAFAFDYVAAGIPLAPRSVAGDRGGVRIAANNSAGAVNTQTLFHNVTVAANQYIMTVDLFMAFQGSSGTTVMGHIGVGGNGTTPNSIFTPISGSGSFMSVTGDGGSPSDYRWFLSSVNGGPTAVPNSNASYLGNGSNNLGAFYSSLFPSPPSTVVGSPGNIWTTIEVHVNNSTGGIQYFMTNPNTNNRALIFDNTVPGASLFTGSLNGFVSLGLHDPFASLSPGSVFAVYDNLQVQIVPEPGSALLLGSCLSGFCIRRRRV